MANPRHVYVVRCWLLCVAAMLVAWSLPEMTLACIPMLMMPPIFIQCANCSAAVPNTVQVDLSGFTDNDCTNCDESYNGSFIVAWNSTLSTGGNCRWTYDFPTSCHGRNQLLLQLTATFALTVVVTGGGVTPMSWRNLLGSAPDCSAWSATAVVYLSGWTEPGAPGCTHDHSNVPITAL